MLKTSDNYTVRRAIMTSTQILQNASSLQHLTLIICHQFRWEGIIHVDWSLLADFLSSRRSSFRHTDLYIRAVKAGGEVPVDEVMPLLSCYDNLMSLVEAGHVSIKENMNHDDDNTNTFRLIKGRLRRHSLAVPRNSKTGAACRQPVVDSSRQLQYL